MKSVFTSLLAAALLFLQHNAAVASPGVFLRGTTFDAEGDELDSYAIGERDADNSSPLDIDAQGVQTIQIDNTLTHPIVLVEEGLSCTLYLKDIEYVDEETNTTSTDEAWYCELSESSQAQYNASRMVLVEGVDLSHLDGGVSGFTQLQVSGEAMLSDGHLTVPSSAKVDTVPIAGRRRRRLQQSTGTLKTLVVRVTYNNKNEAGSLDQMKKSFFTDDHNLKERYEACSYNKLKIQPFSGTTSTGKSISGGAVNVNMGTNPSQGKDKLEDAAQAAAKSQLGNLEDQFDLVIYCQPKGSGNWAAYAYINGFESFYNHEACLSMSVQVHEVGHNLGLPHSGQDGNAYKDQSGFMSVSYNVEFEPLQCFNVAKNFQLGWYDNKLKTINPTNVGTTTQKLNGISHYSDSGRPIGLRLEQTTKTKDFYVGYNRKYGINDGTVEDGDRVVILSKNGDPDSYVVSYKEAALEPGQDFSIQDFDGTGQKVKITFESVGGTNNKEATISIQVFASDATPAPTPACTPFKVEITTDDWPGDTSIEVTPSGSSTPVYTNSDYRDGRTKYTDETCLSDGCYDFKILDSNSDGICCHSGPGAYKGYLNGQSIFSGGAFGSAETKNFCVGSSPSPSPIVLEARDATLKDARIRTNNAGHTNGYIDYGARNSHAWWRADVPTSGTYQVTIYYAAAASDRGPMVLYMAGDKIGEFSIPHTGSWQNWKTESFTANLSAGNDKEFKLVAKGNGGANVDKIILTRQ